MSNARSSSWKRLGCFWGAGAVALAILIGIKLKQNIERGRAPGLQQQAYLLREQASDALYRKLQYALKAGMTRAEVEAVANGGKPIWTHPFLAEDADFGKREWLETGFIRDSATGGEVQISFTRNGDGWRGYGPTVRNPPQEPQFTGAWVLGEEIRGRTEELAPLVWWLLLIAWPFVGRRIKPALMAQLIFGVGFVWLASSYLEPYYFMPGNRPLGWWFSWALVAPIIGAIAWINASLISCILKPRDPNVCPHCTYNLTGNISGVCPECGTKIADIGLKFCGTD
jgi:hypothetical protein